MYLHYCNKEFKETPPAGKIEGKGFPEHRSHSPFRFSLYVTLSVSIWDYQRVPSVSSVCLSPLQVCEPPEEQGLSL